LDLGFSDGAHAALTLTAPSRFEWRLSKLSSPTYQVLSLPNELEKNTSLADERES
jgi:hypothetical protein